MSLEIFFVVIFRILSAIVIIILVIKIRHTQGERSSRRVVICFLIVIDIIEIKEIVEIIFIISRRRG